MARRFGLRSNSTTLRNLASVKITRNRDGTVGIVARRNAPKRSNRKRNRGGIRHALKQAARRGDYTSRLRYKFRAHAARAGKRLVARGNARKARKR